MKKKILIGGVALMLLVGTAGAAEDFTIMKGIHADALTPSEMAGTVGGKLSNKQKQQLLQQQSAAQAQAAYYAAYEKGLKQTQLDVINATTNTVAGLVGGGPIGGLKAASKELLKVAIRR